MERKTIRQLAEGVLARMGELGYSECVIGKYRGIYGRYAAFADSAKATHHDAGLAARFLEETYAAGTKSWKLADRACRMIGYFEASGEIAGRTQQLDVMPPEASARYLEAYIADCAQRGLSARTIAARNRALCQFLRFVDDAGVPFPEGVDAAPMDSWAEERHSVTPGSMHMCLSSVRCLMSFLFSIGVTESDLSALVPADGRYPTKRAVKVWTDEEIASLVASIDTADASGKRDKAVCMLLVTYGMRSGDVCALRFSDLDFDACAIEFTQDKTKAPNTLPMTDGVAWALADWILNGRPEGASCDEVFTTLTPPFGPMSTTSNIVNKRMSMAGIAKVPGASSGAHSIRHTVATKMVSKGAPLPVVSSVLGHGAEDTTMIYVHSDVDGLRRCALGEGVV